MKKDLKANMLKFTRVIKFIGIVLLVSQSVQNGSAQDFKISTTSFKTRTSSNSSTKTRSAIMLSRVENTSNLSKYGGDMDVQLEATGHFRTEIYNGSWYLVDPDGHPFLSVAPNSVTAHHAPLNIPEDLLAVGFNSLGNWSDFEEINAGEVKMPYATRVLFISSFKNTSAKRKALYKAGVIPVFDPEFVTHAQHTAQVDVAPLASDPWIIGIYTDNEMPIYSNTKYGDLLERFLKVKDSDPNDPNYLAAKGWLEKRGKTETSFDDTDKDVFHGYVMERYSQVVNDAMKLYAPKLLNLGTRLHGAAKVKEYIFSAIAPHVDVISVNYYGEYQPSFSDHLDMWLERANKPYIISEFYAKGADAGLAIAEGAGQAVPTQTDRARFYENWTLRLLQHRACVGWQWHRFQDKAAPEDNTDDSNKGFVSQANEWYEPLKSTVTRVSQDLYQLKNFMSNEYRSTSKLKLLPLVSDFEKEQGFGGYIPNYLAEAKEAWSMMSNHTEHVWDGFKDVPEGATYTTKVVSDARGAAALQITMPKDAVNTRAVLRSFPASSLGLKAGRYKLSFYAKTDASGISDGASFIGVQDADNTFFTLTSSYAKYEAYVVIGTSESENRFEIIFKTPANGISKEYKVWIDDITIEKDERATSFDVRGIDHTLSIYPNPTLQLLNVKSEESIKGIKIYNMGARLMMNIHEIMGPIDVSALPQGVYTIVVELNSGVVRRVWSKQ